jgi:hypothetical protein
VLARGEVVFVGHYGVSFVLQKSCPAVPLWHLFLAVQLVDIGWAVLVLLGVEKARITQGFPGSLPLDLYYMPYTHSLPAAIVWSLAACAAYRLLIAPRGQFARRASVLVALAVFSHWPLDVVVHRADLPLYDDAHKVGLALWNHPWAALSLESALYFGGLWLYLRGTRAHSFAGRYGLALLGAAILAIQILVFWWPVLPSTEAAAVIFLVTYLHLAAMVRWLEKKRAPYLGSQVQAAQQGGKAGV